MQRNQINEIALPNAPIVIKSDTSFKQSANVLFNFMPKLEYLTRKLSQLAMIPRYYEESIEYLELDGLEKVAFPMVCFCDIHLNRLTNHMGSAGSEVGYGRFGIGMDKNWGISNGVQPIGYINTSSSLINDYKISFQHALIQESHDIGDEVFRNYLTTQLLYIKPLYGAMLKKRDDRVSRLKKNFHDEREWRFVPNFSNVTTELELIIPQDEIVNNANNTVCETYSKGLEEREELWLKFQYEDIKYLIVDTNEDRIVLIDFIMNELNINQSEKLVLISNIIVFTQIEKDW